MKKEDREGDEDSQDLKGSQRTWGRLRRGNSRVRRRTKKEWCHEAEGKRALEGQSSQKSKNAPQKCHDIKITEIHLAWQANPGVKELKKAKGNAEKAQRF